MENKRDNNHEYWGGFFYTDGSVSKTYDAGKELNGVIIDRYIDEKGESYFSFLHPTMQDVCVIGDMGDMANYYPVSYFNEEFDSQSWMPGYADKYRLIMNSSWPSIWESSSLDKFDPTLFPGFGIPHKTKVKILGLDFGFYTLIPVACWGFIRSYFGEINEMLDACGGVVISENMEYWTLDTNNPGIKQTMLAFTSDGSVNFGYMDVYSYKAMSRCMSFISGKLIGM